MSVVKYRDTTGERISEGIERRLGHTDRLMIALVDFSNGPQERPEPAHSHPHDQAGYVAEGEIVLFLGAEEHRLAAIIILQVGLIQKIQQGSDHGSVW